MTCTYKMGPYITCLNVPIRWVHILHVSVWILNVDLKHSKIDSSCGRCPLRRYSLSLRNTGKASNATTSHLLEECVDLSGVSEGGGLFCNNNSYRMHRQRNRGSNVTFGVYRFWRAYWWLFCFVCCLRSVTWGSHDDACMMRGRRWHCHLASASLCGTVGQWAFDQGRRTSYIGMKAHA